MNLWNKLNYKMRLFMLIMAFTWIVSFVMFGIFYYREKEFKAESTNANLQIYNAQLLSELEDGFEDGVEYADSNSDSVRFTIMDTLGTVLYDTRGLQAGTDRSDRQEIIKTMNNGFGYTQNRVSTIDGQRHFYSAMKGRHYIVRVSMPYDLTLIDALENETIYLWTLFIVTVVLSILAFFASRQFGQNMARLRDFATLAERGELADVSAFDFPGDELGETSRLIINIYNKWQRISQERDRYYQNMLDEEHEKSQIKHQLTTNINHEIKTPVHAIHGCLETVLENIESLERQQIKDFLEKGYAQVLRLNELLNDVSMITRITDAPHQIKKEQLDVAEIIDDIKEEVEMLPDSKSMRFNVEVPSTMPIVANRRLLESIFKNLVNNSLAYSGGRDMFLVLLSETETDYTFSFSDNGVGIEEKHFSRIFERFYRVDDGRSRIVGGTGLGLSIVKNSVNFHGGEIIVKNRMGGGIEFVFNLSKKIKTK